MKRYLELTFWQKITHYFIVPFLLFIPVMTVIDLVKIFVTNSYSGVRSVNELVLTSLPFFILGIAYIFIQKGRLKYYELDIKYANDQFNETVRRTAKELNWKIEHNSKDFFRAYRASNWTGSFGEMITIIKDENKLYLNSICDPNRMSSVVSYGWNKKNLKTFLFYLKEVMKERREKNE
jgi:hypothetical protein